ncbi:hypothetical protein F4808DRAFT_465101 [Astrocystis sublimbata]|nr:hypothetical protein F4808DRAFT_465101 [Astrocystis sublimbata]
MQQTYDLRDYTNYGYSFPYGIGRSVPLEISKEDRDDAGSARKLREHILQTITEVFKREGASLLSTPIFEIGENLAGEWSDGPRTKNDSRSKLYSIRHRLTPPFARWLALRPSRTQIKTYRVGQVYCCNEYDIRHLGALPEFYQCDFDIAGEECNPMFHDAEVLEVIVEMFKALKLDFVIRINHHKILRSVLAARGVPHHMVPDVALALDKWRQTSWEQVKRELAKMRLSEKVAEPLHDLECFHGDMSKALGALWRTCDRNVIAGVKEIETLLSYLEKSNIAEYMYFDMSLGRGLDDYSGIVFEVIVRHR